MKTRIKTVYDLSQDELNELKEVYAVQLSDDGISYEEFCDSHEMPNEVIFEHYREVTFTEDDFFCNQN